MRESSSSGDERLRRFPYDLTERFFAVLPRCELANLYGPTEASVDVTSWACLREDSRGIVPIGRPISNIACYVLDSHLNPCPIGDRPGELYLAGVGLARGYLARPDLSSVQFVPVSVWSGGADVQDG